MEQNYQPDFGQVLQGKSIQTCDAEIMAAVRKMMMADRAEHPKAVTPVINRSQLVPKSNIGKRTIRSSLASLLPDTFRGMSSAPKAAE